MKIALLFPPDWNSLWMPYGSTPSLKAYLREGGVEVNQHDLNIEVYDRMLHPRPLLDLWKQTPWEKDLEAPTPGAPGRTEVGAILARQIDEITEGVEEAVSVLRTPEKFYDQKQYQQATRVIDGAILLIAAASWELDDALRTPATAFEAAKDPSVNVYLPHIEELLQNVISGKPDIVGLSVIWPRQMIPAISIASLIKAKLPDVHVALGGDYPTLIAHVIERTPELFEVFDSVAISEGEVASLALTKAVEEGGKLREVPGILHLDNDKVEKTSLPVMEDADVLPTPDFDQLPLDKYLSPEPVLPVFSSRGCFWRRCVFCVRPDRRTFSQRSPQQVIKDLSTLNKKHKVRAFHFCDNAIRQRRMAEIADGIVEAGLEVTWTARTRFSPEMTWDWCDQVAAGGCARIIFGVESASKRILELVDKGFRLDDVPGILQGLSKSGIDSTLYFMVGFPGEKTDDAKKTLQFVERLQDTLTPYAQYYITRYAVGHGSIAHQKPDQFGITRIAEYEPKDMRNPYYYDFDADKSMKRKDLEKRYRDFLSRFEKLMQDSYRMPHDMLMRLKESQESGAKAADAQFLKMNTIPKLAEDLRAEKGYLLKGKKKFRIDEPMRDLIDLLDSKRTVKELLELLCKSQEMKTPAAFIYAQQLYEEGIIEVSEPE